jgi:hypothetical protein
VSEQNIKLLLLRYLAWERRLLTAAADGEHKLLEPRLGACYGSPIESTQEVCHVEKLPQITDETRTRLQILWKKRCVMKKRLMTLLVSLLLFALTTTGCGTLTGAAVGAGSGAAVGAGTGYGAKKGALVGTGIGAAAGAIYDITR